MRVAVLVVAAVIAFGATMGRSHAQEPTATPNLEATPAGEFRVEPASGPVGTVVTLTGSLDQDIHFIRFHCFYYQDTIDEGLVDQQLEAPSRSFSIPFEIPATLSIRQGGGETRATPVGRCEFLAIAGHQLLGRAAPFSVTAGLPSTGLSGQEDARGPTGLVAGVLLVLGVALLGAAGWLRQLQPSEQAAAGTGAGDPSAGSGQALKVAPDLRPQRLP